MQLIFKKIRYQNFMSVGNNPIEIQLDKSPNTLICGHNGAGKSVLLEALTFSLFGKSYRGINKPSLVNSTNQKGCLVEIWFSKGNDEYKISRGISPNIFIINKNGVDLDVDSASKDQQTFFETSILGSDFKTFSQLVIVGAASYTPFMRLTAAQRREMVETILDIGVFSNMNRVLKGKISAWKQDHRETVYQIDKIKSEIKLLSDFIKKADINSQKEIDELQEKLDTYIEKAKIYKADIQRLQSKEEIDYNAHIENFRSIKQSLEKDIAVHKHSVANIHKDLNFFMNHDNCPTCSQSIDVAFKSSKLESLKTADNEKTCQIGKLQKSIEDTTKELFKVQEDANKQNENRLQVRDLKAKMTSLKETVLDTMSRIEKLKKAEQKDTTSEKDAVFQKNAELSVYEKRKRDLEDKKDLYDKALKLLKDDGLKSLIIKKYIPILNTYVNKYLRILNFNVTFELDENFNENLKTRYKNEFKYHNFSMGERQRLDLALMFAWLQVARSKNSLSTNLLILDEVEGHLDKSGSDDVLEISENLGDDMNIFVISHKETMEDRIRSIIRFEKVNGFTKNSS